MGRCQKVSKFDFQSQFSTSKIIRNFLIFSLENMNLGAHFLSLTFLDNINFPVIFFSKMMPHKLNTTPILKIKKFQISTVDFQQKTFQISYTSLKNSTTGIVIMGNSVQIRPIKYLRFKSTFYFYFVLIFFWRGGNFELAKPIEYT